MRRASNSVFKMKRIAITQRVDIIESYGERRDAIDQHWTDFLLSCGLFPVFMPNHEPFVRSLLSTDKIDGFLLTGGNSLIKYGGNAPERDNMERTLLEYAIQRQLPVLGVCRGMQVIQDYFGVELTRISGHAATRHTLKASSTGRYFEWLNGLESVNAYHNFGAYHSVTELPVAARAIDDVVMAVEHTHYPVFGQMWHSERETHFVENEMEIFRNLYERGPKWQ